MANEVQGFYTGTFEHPLDEKGRLTVPAEWRWGTFEQRLFILHSSENCLKVYPESWMGKLYEKISSLKSADPVRQAIEVLAGKAQPTTFDQQGRIMVKDKLRKEAGLKKNAVLEGRMDHFQIWDQDVWKKRKAETAMTLEAALAAIGI